MPVYFIVEIKTKNKAKDKEAYAQYVQKVRPIAEKYSGKYLSRGGQVIPVFGRWKPERIVLIEFPGVKQVQKWLACPEYKEISALREKSTLTKAIIVRGEEKPV